MKANFGKKWRVCQKFIKGVAKYSNDVTKSGMFTVDDFYKNDKLANITTLARSNEWLAK